MNIKELLSCIIDFDDHIGGVKESLNNLSLKDDQVQLITNDSNKVDKNSVFVALKGTSFDSHELIDEIRQKDPIAIIGQDNQYFTDILVRDSRAIIGPLTAAFYDFPSVKQNIAAVTGTNGKTTVSYLYTSILKEHNLESFTMGTTGILVNAEKILDSQTTPDPILLQQTFYEFLQRGITNGVIEVSSHALDQQRVLGTHFSVAAFTNISQDHLDYHASFDDYIDAKLKLFSKDYTTKAVINLDGNHSESFIRKSQKENLDLITVSCNDPNSDVYIKHIDSNQTSSKLSITLNSENHVIETPLIGSFNYENIATALGMAIASGFEIQTAINAIEHPITVPGRLQRRSTVKGSQIFIDYAHTPDALSRALATLKPIANKLIVVFGAGGDRDKTKRPLMGQAAAEYADEIIITSDNPRSEDPVSIINEIAKGVNKDHVAQPDRYLAIKHAISIADKNDIVLVAGKGHERGQEFKDHTIDFHDMDEVRKILKELELDEI